jgi:hypothetical protein
MFRRLVLLLTLVALFSTAAEAVIVGRGRRGRSYLRHVTYVQKLQNDKREIYNEYGFPVHRHREYAYGEIREFWTYYEHGLEFVFDEDSNLVETNKFWPENRRERIEAFPGY